MSGLNRNDEATTLLWQIIRKTEQDESDNHYNTIIYHHHLTKIFLSENKYIQVIAEWNIVNNYSLEQSIRRRLGSTLGELKDMRRHAFHAMTKER